MFSQSVFLLFSDVSQVAIKYSNLFIKLITNSVNKFLIYKRGKKSESFVVLIITIFVVKFNP